MELSLMCQDFYTTLRFTNEKKEEEKTISTSVFDQVGKVNGLTSTITVAKSNLLGLTCYTLYYYFQAYLQDDVCPTYQYAECHSRSYPLLANSVQCMTLALISSSAGKFRSGSTNVDSRLPILSCALGEAFAAQTGESSCVTELDG